MVGNLVHAPKNDNKIQQKVRNSNCNGKVDRLVKTFEKNGSKQSKQSKRQIDPVLADIRMQIRICDSVLRGISRRKCDRNDEIGPGKTKQHENKEFARPSRHKMFQHGDGALTGV